MATDTIYIPLGNVLSATTNASVVGTYSRVGDAGGSLYAPTALTASTVHSVGPFNEPRTYQFKYSGAITYVNTTSGVYTADDEAALIADDLNTVHKDDTDVSTYDWVLDEDEMTSNSATKVPTQSSVKAYVDANSGGAPTAVDIYLASVDTCNLLISNGLYLTASPQTHLDFSILTASDVDLAGIFGESATTADFSNVESLQSVYTEFSGLLVLNMPAITYLSGTFGPTLSVCTEINLPVLSNIVGEIAPNAPVLETWYSPSLGIAGSVSLSANTISSVDLTGLQEVGGVLLINSTSLTSLSLPALLSVVGNVDLSPCALDVASVNGILVKLAALDGTAGTTSYNNKTISLSGGTNASPTGAGLTAKATLEGRGCTVTVN